MATSHEKALEKKGERYSPRLTGKRARKAKTLETRSKMVGSYVMGHKNFGDVYEA